jgi:KamA family protein
MKTTPKPTTENTPHSPDGRTPELREPASGAGTQPWSCFVRDVDQLRGLTEQERKDLEPVCKVFGFHASPYYLSLIDWNDPDDPIRRLIVPHPAELENWEWGSLDASNEQSYTRMPGLQHKYPSTALLLVSDTCGGQCRYCFRKRIFVDGEQQHTLADVDAAVDYLRIHTEVNNVLMTGGDPLMLPTRKLYELVAAVRGIEHIRIVRIGSRIPAFLPQRISMDPELLDLFRTFSLPDRRLYVMTHFSHPRELTEEARLAVRLMMENGVMLCNQTPLIRGVNSDPDTLAELMAELSYLGIAPYYVFQCRPAAGNRLYAVPLEEAYEIFEEARSQVSGLAKRARFVLSHATGKVEIVGHSTDRTFFKYHRTADDADDYRFMVCRSNPNAYWLDDYEELKAESVTGKRRQPGQRPQA